MEFAESTQVIGAFVLGVVLLPLLNRLALSLGWIDMPNARKLHEGAVPLTGGLTIFAAAGLTIFLTEGRWPEGTVWLVVGLAFVFFTGLWDDRYPLQARYRLVAQLLAAASIALGSRTTIESFGQTFAPFEIGLWFFAVPMTIVALTGLVNAFNMADGADGLCSGYVLIALTSLLIAAGILEQRAPHLAAYSLSAPVVLPFIGAVAAFLIFNLRHPWRARASAFLGDAGSMALGFLVGWMTLRLAGIYGPHTMPPVVAVYIVALPLADMFSCMLRRHLDGVTPMSADRKHLHHLLISRGLDIRQTVMVLHAIAAGLALLGIGGWVAGVPEYLMFWALIALFSFYTVAALRYWRNYDERYDAVFQRAIASQSVDTPVAKPGGLISNFSVDASAQRNPGPAQRSAGPAQRSAIDAGASSVRR